MENQNLASRLLAMLLAVAISLPAAVVAGPEEAAEFYKRASEAYQAGDLREAADLLERAYAEDPNLIYQYNRVLALQGLGEYEAALRVLEIYQSPMEEDPDRRFEDIRQIKKELQTSIERKKDLEAKRKAEAEGEEGETLAEGERETTVEKKEVEVVATTEPEPVEREPNYLAWGMVGAGAVSLGTGLLFGSGVFISEEIDRAEEASDFLDDNELDDFTDVYGEDLTYADARDQYRDDVDTIDSHQLWAGIFIGTGAALLITGGVIWLLDSADSESATASHEVPDLKIGPGLVRDGFGLQLQYDF